MRKGVSPLIGSVIVILITVTAIAIVLGVALPMIERAKESALLNEALQNMRVLDTTIREVSSEGVGSMRTLILKVTGGTYTVSEKSNSVDFVYYVKSGIVEPGTFVREGNLMLMSGVEARTSESDLDGDGQIELVLENEIIKVGIQKVGNKTNWQNINTSTNIKALVFKENNATIKPADSSVILDDLAGTSSGNGYTEFVRTGDNLAKAEATVHVNTTSVAYDVLYTLQSGADFVLIKVQNAYYK